MGKGGNILLQELKVRWTNHQIMNKWLKKFFTYLDRYYVKHHTLPTLTQAGLKAFRTTIFDETKQGITDAILNLINAEREGEIIDKSLVKAIVELYESMGIGSLDTYNTDLEVPMLEAAREFYAKKQQDWLASDSTQDYLDMVEAALDKERMRVADYLNQSSEAKLIRVCEEELLERVVMELLEKEGSGCRALLANDKFKDLRQMFRMFSRLKNGLNLMASIVEIYIFDRGNEIINMRQAQLTAGEEHKPDELTFVKHLIAHHDKYLAVVMTDFGGHFLFQKAFAVAFEEIVNSDSGAHSNAELMSTFCDRVLKSGGEKMSKTEVEKSLDSIVHLFSYLIDKDLFAGIYSV
jgi:cullin 1